MQKELLRGKEARKVTLVGFIVNAVLAVGKIFAGVTGKSGAMLADGIHSLSDFLTDIVVLVGFKLTEQPEDECHNYGHDKYETLATAIISLFLCIVGFEIFKAGYSKIMMVIRGELLPKPGMIALYAAILSIASKEILYHYTYAVSKKINSPSLRANAWHHRSDAMSSIGTLFGIGGAILLGSKWTVLDPVASIIVSIFIFKVAYEIMMPAVNELMESALSEEEIGFIEKVLTDRDDVMEYHKLRTRRFGTKAVIECHILVDENLNIRSAHEISSNIENELFKEFGEGSIITLHIEPFQDSSIRSLDV